MTEDEWMALANIALIAASSALRHGAGKLSKDDRKPLDITADYCDAIRDQMPRKESK